MINTGDTAWILISTGLVLLMMPGLALFYGGLVRTKNVLSTFMHSFVVSDVVRGVHKIYFFDEHCQGKGADALCTLRMKYHLEKLDVETPAQFSVSTLDNCVGQNKSQVMMKFYCMLGLCFYETVGCVFLISGHSHMLPDRATSHAKRALKLKNVWHPNQLINLV